MAWEITFSSLRVLFCSWIEAPKGMKFQVVYPRQKKKGSSIQRATFFDIEDAIYWEKVINKQGIKETRIEVKDWCEYTVEALCGVFQYTVEGI